MYFTTDSTWNQIYIFAVLLCSGMVLGLIFAAIDGQKRNIRKNFLKILCDIMFCIIMFLLMGATLYMTTNGKIQGYMVLSLGVGFFISRWLFEKTVKNTINKANRLLKILKKRLNKKAK